MEDFKNLNETLVTSEKVFDGRVVHLYKDTVELPNGKHTTREVIRHAGAVAIVPLTYDNKVIVERQFRYPLNRVITEIPAGKIDIGEEPLDAAKRELKEETGYTATKWYYLGGYHPTPAYTDECIHMYLARGLERGEQNLDNGEFLNVMEVDLDYLALDVLNNKITDGKTQTAILKTFLLVD
jgi:ADP-ribose pyrophosphatase